MHLEESIQWEDVVGWFLLRCFALIYFIYSFVRSFIDSLYKSRKFLLVHDFFS